MAQVATARQERGVKPKDELIQRAYQAFASLHKPGDSRCYPWLAEGLREIKGQADELSYEELRVRLKALYLRYRAIKRDSGRASARKPREAGAEAAPRKELVVPIELQVREDVQPVREGQHNAVIRSIKERESKFSDSKHDTYLAISYEITDGKDAGRILVKGYTPVLSSKSHLGKLWRRLKGSLPVGKTIDVEELIGEPVQIIVAHEIGDDGDVRVRISEVFKPLSSEEKAKEPAEAVR
jgi:hypothetical protein